MYHFVTSSKDSTIYLQQPSQNTGLDEIIEVSKTFYGNLKDNARALIKFDTTPLSQSIASGDITMSSAHLLLKESDANEIPMDYTIYAYPISQSWDMGIGTRFDDISTDGVSWENRGTSTESWLGDGGYASGTSGSFNGKGGTWYTGSVGSQDFSYQSSDIEMNVLSSMNSWIGGTLPNEGFIVKHSDAKEADTVDYGELKFFGKETATIYQPKIRIGWDDSVFTTGSLTELTSEEINVTFKRLKVRYKVGSTPMIRVFGREKYPLKTYTNTYAYNDLYYLPSTTYYQIKDIVTGDVIIPFNDNYTKVSCDTNGNYFKLDLSNFEYNRDYYIEIKTVRDGAVDYFSDKDLTFRVEV